LLYEKRIMNESEYEKLSAAVLGAGNGEGTESLATLPLQATAEERAVLQGFMRVLQGWPYALDQQAPPAALKQKILAAVRQPEPAPSTQSVPLQLWKSWTTGTQPEDLVIQHREAGAWEATGVEGVEVKRLFVDAGRGYVTMLVRMAAGSTYPSHRHAGYEECYVLQGDLSVGDTVLQAGDYQRAKGGSVHTIQSTKNGCTLFIVSSQHDELLV